MGENGVAFSLLNFLFKLRIFIILKFNGEKILSLDTKMFNYIHDLIQEMKMQFT